MVKVQVWMELAPGYSRLVLLSLVYIYLAQIFNQSLNIGYVPKCWKIKRVSPIHKGDKKTDPNNFRPIPMKIFEKIVYIYIHDQVSVFIKTHV